MESTSNLIRLRTRPAGRRRWSRLLSAAVIVGSWTLVALAWTPPTYVLQTVSARGHDSPSGAVPLRVFLFVLLGFVPWMLATPLLMRWGRRFALSERSIAPPLAIHLLTGAIAVPALSLAGGVLGTLFVQSGKIHFADLHQIAYAGLLSAFYLVPTYIAVVAVGQALAYFDRYRQRERLLARAELQALQAQIHPHFLFNTLNAIATLGYRDPARADTALTMLSELIRRSLHEQPQEVALKDEIAFVRAYLDLYALLLGDALVVSFDVEGPAWNASVPTMLLQPLVENAIVHGVARLANGGRIALRAHATEGRLALSIVNDVPESGAASGGGGIGLANVRERLRVIYGDQQALELRCGDGQVAVDIALPLRIASA